MIGVESSSYDGTTLTIGITREVDVLGVAVFADALSPAQIAAMLKYSGPYTMPLLAAYWTDPPFVPQTTMLYYPPNATIAAGGATLRTAPLVGAQAVMTLAQGTAIHTTGKATAGFTRVYQETAGEAWIDSTKIVS